MFMVISKRRRRGWTRTLFLLLSLLLILLLCIIMIFKTTNAKHHHGHHGFFQYARQPAKGHWEFGYRRGNHEHFTERHEHGASHSFKSKVRWGDKHGGYGEHYFDYNHKGTGEEGPYHYKPQYHQPKQHNSGHYGGHGWAASASIERPVWARRQHPKNQARRHRDPQTRRQRRPVQETESTINTEWSPIR